MKSAFSAIAVIVLATHTLAGEAAAQGQVVGWGMNAYQQCRPRQDSLLPAIQLATGYRNNLVVLADGTVRMWGQAVDTNLPDLVPSDLGKVTAVSGGGDIDAIALLADGTVRCWGLNVWGICSPPPYPPPPGP